MGRDGIMSVLACGRNGCDAAMCDLMIAGMYICADCAAEFRMWMRRCGMSETTRKEMVHQFRKFMETEKLVSRGEEVIDLDTFLAVREWDEP